jgi:hypothetical protein
MMGVLHRLAAAAVVAAVAFGGSAASAATYISSFSRTTNDGVFELSQAQAGFLGVPTADRIGYFRVRSGGSPVIAWSAGDTFDGASVLASVTSNAGAILGLFNGENEKLGYSGDAWKPLGTTTLLEDSDLGGSLFRAVAFAFSSGSGNIVFRGSTTFNGAQSQGASLAPVPVPAALPLLLGGLAVMGVVARRRRAAAA